MLNLSLKVKRYLKRENKKLVYNKKTVGTSYNHIKDVSKKDRKFQMIYGSPCLDCEKIYVGQTRYIHSTEWNNINRDVNDKGWTALCSHFFKEKHRFDFENVEILDNEQQLKKNFGDYTYLHEWIYQFQIGHKSSQCII